MRLRPTIEALARHQVPRFLLLGGLAAAINWLARFPLSVVLPMGWAVLVAYLIGMSVGFHLYATYVFPGAARSRFEQAMTFLAVNLVGAVLVLGLTYAFLALQPVGQYAEWIREGAAHGLAIGLGAIANFFGHKLLTFHPNRAPAVGQEHQRARITP